MRLPAPRRLAGRAALLLPLAACGGEPAAKADSAATPSAAVAAPDAGAPGNAPADDRPLAAGEGRLAVDGGRIWYRVVGAGTGTPVVLLHGGPGLASYSLKSLEALGDERLVVRYDQLGAGRSDRLTDTTRMTVAHYVAELEALRAHLGYERVHLVGHSWGTILGVEYYRAHPQHVASLTLSGPALDIPAWVEHARALVRTLPDSTQQAIREAEASGKFDDPRYQRAVEAFDMRYLSLRPDPVDLDSTLKTMNPAIYGYMQGPSEFTITGTLRGYDATPYLKAVKVPTLFTVGEFDEAGPALVRTHAALVPGAKAVVIPGAAHLTTWDAPEATTAAIRAHLRAADGAPR